MRVFYLSLVLFLFPTLVHAACVLTPDCVKLGYVKTTADCPNGGVKCPFDSTKMYCKARSAVKQVCNVGDILYSDMTCAATKEKGKTAIGVVSHVKGKDYLAISLIELEQGWAKNMLSVPGVSTLPIDFVGKANTAAWVAYYGDISTYAPGYCYNYTTAGTKKGDWYLPAVAELKASVYTNNSAVNAGISLAGGTVLFNNIRYASMLASSEFDSTYSWCWSVFSGELNPIPTRCQKNIGGYRVRCVIAF